MVRDIKKWRTGLAAQKYCQGASICEATPISSSQRVLWKRADLHRCVSHFCNAAEQQRGGMSWNLVDRDRGGCGR